MIPSVAIIMRSMNERPYLDRSLASLFTQSYTDFTLYNVDSGSTDGSVELIKNWNADHFVQIEPEEYMPGKVLNEMIESAVEPIVVFLNSDAIPTNEHWLEELIKPLLEGRCEATMSRQIARKDAYFIVDYDYIRAYDAQNIVKDPYFFSAVSCAFKRELWEETKFYTEGYSEDTLWCKECSEKGAKFLYVPESIVEHSHNYTLSELYNRKFNEGKADRIIHGTKGKLIPETIGCIKELVRDGLYTLSKGEITKIPYNLAYRLVARKGLYDGRRGIKR